MIVPPAITPTFPTQQEYARLLFQEAVRNFRDGYVLHRNRRFAAAITSAVKAVEIGLKSLLMLDASTTMVADVFQTHRIFQAYIIEMNIYKSTHASYLDSYDPNLRRRIIELEQLIPSKPSAKKTDFTDVVNTEYPFFVATTTQPTQLIAPGIYFGRSESAKHLKTARDVLKALLDVYPTINSWGITL